MKLKIFNLNFIFFLIFFILLSMSLLYFHNFFFPQNEKTNILLNFSAGITFLIFAILNLFIIKYLGTQLKINISILFISTISTLFIIETGLYISNEPYVDNPFKKKRFMESLEIENKTAYPQICPRDLMNTKSHNDKKNVLAPLGGISNIHNFFSNESGFYPVIKTDKYGFNNQNRFYEEAVDILLLGDSFVEGFSVEPQYSIANYLREKGKNVINFGKCSNGSLREYATLVEYGTVLNPGNILFFYYPNDISNISDSLKSPILNKYLDVPGYSQNLINKQSEIDNLLTSSLEETCEFNSECVSKIKFKNLFIIKLLKFYNIRQLFSPFIIRKKNIENNSKNIEVFNEVMLNTKRVSNSLNAKLYFIYLPSYNDLMKGEESENKQSIKKIINNLNIEWIDIENDIFKKEKNISNLFPKGFSKHYNQLGYKKIAENLDKKILW